jgi:rhodanese-related sulfurtransferase/DNA-binding transcriptional ArsR family regulator
VTSAESGRARASGWPGSGTRLRLLQLLTQRESPVQELAAVAGLNLTTASAHLQVLREAGLVSSRRDGRRVLYRIAGPDVVALVNQLYRVAERRRPAVRADLEVMRPMDGIELMSRDELLAASREGRVVVLDVRPAEEFAAGHLAGALSIPLPELEARLAELPADVEVVAYCRGRYCVLSHRAVRLLQDHGIDARLSEDGVAEWLAAGMSLQSVTG